MTLNDFWNYTIDEVTVILDNYGKQLQEEIENKQKEIYNLASLIAYFVGCNFSGKKPDSFETLFGKSEEPQQQMNVDFIKEAFTDFAIEHNKRRAAAK